MNKTLLIASTVAAFIFASCNNDNTTNPEPTGTATIKGTLISDLDMDEDELKYEKVPVPVQLYFFSEDEALLATATTGTDGTFTQELTISRPQTITIVVGDFTTNVNIDDGTGDFVSKPALYNSHQNFDVDVVKGGTFIKNLQVTRPTVINF